MGVKDEKSKYGKGDEERKEDICEGGRSVERRDGRREERRKDK